MLEKNSQENAQPWVSFCMTTYKRPEFLKEQLQTILKQTFKDFSIIISDNDIDGSGEEVVREINDPRIFYYRNEENLGMVKSFNRSLAKAKSEYVVMITDDDPVYPNMLTILRELTLKYPGYGMYMGGCDILCQNPTVARSSRLKVGTNSCLANLPIGTIRTYSGEQFPFAYFKGEIGGHLLWSTGIVRREIALAIDGMPDFGAPYNTDFGYIVLSGSQAGAVLINTSLGCQVVHGANYGFTESQFDRLYLTPEAFLRWVMERLPSKYNYDGLDKYIKTFLARWVVEYAVSIHKFLETNEGNKAGFNNFLKKTFKIPYLKKWKYKYLLAVKFPSLFEFIVDLKQRFSLRTDRANA
jgi:glycosyltransferase involved in cell wall biosynthesis